MNELKGLLKGTRKHLMTGVSYMIPFVVTGGVILSLCVIFSGENAVPSAGALGKVARIGSLGLSMMVPILSGYIAFSLAERAGLAPGIIGGLIANEIGAGFLGGIASGLIAGILVYYLKKIKVPNSLRSVMPIFVIPLVGSFAVSCTMLFLLGEPIAVLMSSLSNWLNHMSNGNSVILSLILGAMNNIDFGGPIGKVSYGFGTAMLSDINPATGLSSDASMMIMAAVGVSCAIPPLACGISTLLFKSKFSVEEKEAGKAALVMGVVSISEGAIPFAANDPLRVIPSCVVGGSIGAAISMALKAANPAPWGGIIVAPIVSNPFGYMAAILAGSIIAALLMGFLKKPVSEAAAAGTEESDDFDLEMENF